MHDMTQLQTEEVDLGIAWTWEYDAPFIHALRKRCEESGISVLEIVPENIEPVTRSILEGKLRCRWLYDRASDEDDSFRALASFVLAQHRSDATGRMSFINPTDDARRAADKATMHLEFLTHHIHVPHTVILPPYAEQPDFDIPESDMEELGRPFIIKPANTTGGGTGVILDATNVTDVMRNRMTYQDDKYLLQKKVVPAYLSEARAWFRVFYAFGEIRVCWWDDLTHIYDDVTADEDRWFKLGELRESMKIIAQVCRLDFFSSEFAQTSDEKFLSVDYVNELCDMRPKSTTPDGVPDKLIDWVADRITTGVRRIDGT
jgi:glutathione synthase/RimK-type ligase-like ATP-grasp enzyme